MLAFVLRRILVMIPTLLVISFVTFAIIKAPPGDYLSNQLAEMQARGDASAVERIEFLRQEYSLDRPFMEQYAIWLGVMPGNGGYRGILQGDLGYSFANEKPVVEVIGDRFWLTVLVAVATTAFTYIIAFPIGAYSAVRQYSTGDYALTLVGYIGLAAPNFLLALVLMYLAQVWFGTSIGGLMDPEYIDAPWTADKIWNVLAHLWIPVIVIGTSGTAGMSRRLRANLLDELQKPYVTTARAKGVGPMKLLMKYPFRLALNPFIADIGNILPQILSGSVIVSTVMSLETTGPMMLQALQSQDQYLAGSFLLFLSVLTVVGMAVSDIALAALDPRIRIGAEASK